MRGPAIFMFKAMDIDRARLACASAVDVANFCLEAKRWGMGMQTPHAWKFNAGDVVLIYAGGKRKGGASFIASCEIKARTTAEPFTVCGRPWPASVRLDKINRFKRPLPMAHVLPNLSFYKVMKNKEKWGVAMMGGVRRLTYEDLTIILNARVALESFPVNV